MHRFGRIFRSVAFSVVVGGFAAPPAAGQVSDVWFAEPHDGTMWHRGDLIRVRVVPGVPVSVSNLHPVLQLVIGENTREAEGRFFPDGSRAIFSYAVQTDDAAPADEVRATKVSVGGVDIELSGFTPTTHAVDGSSRGAPPALRSVGLSSFFFVPVDGVYRPGDEIYWHAAFHKAVTVSGAPVLAQRIGEEMREARYRPDVRSLDGLVYFTYTVQAGDCDMDGVGLPANAISGGSIREADGVRKADTSHPAQDPSRAPREEGTRYVVCAVVPALPAPWPALLASLLLAAGARRWAVPRRDRRRIDRAEPAPATGSASWRAAPMVAVLLLASTPLAVDAGAAPQDDDRQGQAERPAGELADELSRALGMTPAEVEALGLSPGEMRNLLAGFAEETVVVGSRAQPRSATESAVPVEVLSAADLASRGAGDLKDQLRTTIPSFSVNSQPISGGATVVRPAMLRNLAPDHTLVLVNGKRRHRSSVVDWHGGNGVAFGSQGPDIAAIPAIALRQVEVLRDGAAAQYGSDAIAGVLNFQLKDARAGGSFELDTGMYRAGDGETARFAGNVGLPLGAAGFANLSLEYGNANRTDRAAPRRDALALIAAGNTHVRSASPQPWGDPDIDDDVKLFGNFGYALPAGVQAYAHTSFARKTVSYNVFFRNPNTRLGLFSNDRGRTLLVGDVLAAGGMGSADCPTVTVTDDVPDPVALRQVSDDPNCFTFQELFPGGFTPRVESNALDASLAGGLRGSTAAGLAWDLSGSIGMHETDRFTHNTVNASLGLTSPVGFDIGANRQRDVNVNFDVSYPVTPRVNVAAGAEWRDEHFSTREGDRAGWAIGPYAPQGFTPGSNGSPAYGPVQAGAWGRRNVAAYGDLEVADPDNGWTLGAAARIEDFEDFGTTTNGKVSGRFRFVRGSVSTGFRAPTPGQQHGLHIQSWFDPTVGDMVHNAVIPSISPVARLRGGQPLGPERSTNYTAGVAFGGGPFTLTVDYFRIDLSDRIGITSNFTLTPAEVAEMVAGGFEAAETVTNYRFFTNAFGTTSQGIDIVSTWTPLALRGNTVISAVFNHTDTEVTDNALGLLDGRRLAEYAYALPRTRWNVGVTQRLGRASLLGRLSYYSGWYDYDSGYGTAFDPSGGLAQGFFDGRPIVDVELSVDLGRGTTLSIGGQNVFDTYSQESVIANLVGERYSEYMPWGYSGAYHYARLGYGWGD